MYPKVSAIVPIYNSENYLSICLESIINQTLLDLEIILINDGSTDSSLKIAEDYARKDSRIVVINKKNGGPSTARNIGIQQSTGEFLAFIDSDDLIDKDMLATMYAKATAHNAEIVICNYKKISMDGKVLYKDSILEKEKLFYNEDILKLIENCSQNKITWFSCRNLYKRELLIDNNIFYNEYLKIGEDPIFNLYAFFHCEKLLIIKECFYNYRYNPTSITSSFDYHLLEKLNLNYLEKLKFKNKYFNSQTFTLDIKIYIITHTIYLCFSNYKNDNLEFWINQMFKYDFIKDIVNKFEFRMFFSRKVRIKTKIVYLLMFFKMSKVLSFIYSKQRKN